MKRLHYEFIPGRPVGHEWRVADEDDDFHSDFSTEEAAKKFVQNNNQRFDTAVARRGWRY